MCNEQQQDIGNPKDVKSAKKIQKLIDERFSNGMRKICDDVEIRCVLDAFFKEVGVFHDEPMIPTPDFAYEHGRNAGKKGAGLWWLEQALLHDPDIIGKMKADEDSPIRVKKQKTER